MAKTVAIIAAIGLAASMSGHAQTPAADQNTFRAAVDVVRVDVSVLGKDRRPVRGLTAADFEVIEDGKPRPVVAFSSIDVPGAPAPASGSSWMRDIAPDVTGNQRPDVRRIAIVLDDATTPPEPRVVETAKTLARGIVDRLGPGDQAAVLFTFYSAGAQGFTTDRARLLAAIDRFQPRSVLSSAFSKDFVSASAYFSARTLSNVADYLMGLPDRRKAIALISPGGRIDVTDPHPDKTTDEDRAIAELRELLTRAERANVSVYSLDPCGVGGWESLFPQPVSQEVIKAAAIQRQFLQVSAEHTGGTATFHTDNFEPALAAMFEELSTYYLVGFQPTNPKKDGALRRLEVKVRRPGVTVHARDSYYATRSGAAPASAASSGGPEIDRALRAPGTSSDISLHLATAVFAQRGKSAAKVAVVLGVDLPIPDGRAQVTEKAELLVRAFTPDGEARGSRAVPIDVTLRPTSVRQAYYEILTDLDLAPGRYEVRLALHSATQSKTGSVFHQIEVPDFTKALLALSSVVLSTVPALRSAPANAFAGLLPVVPTASRGFPGSIAVKAFARVYRRDVHDATATLVRTTIANAAGSAVVDTTESLSADRFGSGSGAADFTIDVPVDRLTKGSYLLTINASTGNLSSRRDVRFVIVD